MCYMTGCLGGFDVGVGSVHSKISHASVVALVSYVPGAGSCGNHRGWILPSAARGCGGGALSLVDS